MKFLFLILLIAFSIRGNSRGISKLYVADRIDITSLGAKGDGNFDNTSIIQNAINRYCNKNVALYFPAGRFIISKTINISKPYVSLFFSKGAELISRSTPEMGLISVQNDNFTINGASLIGCGKSASNIYNGYGILLLGVSSAQVSNCTFKYISGCGILLKNKGDVGCNYCVLQNNTLTNPAAQMQDGAGILLGYSGRGYMHKFNTIKNNTLDGNFVWEIGIGIISHGDHNTIQNNTVKNFLSYGILSYESEYIDSTLMHTVIKNNYVQNIGAKNKKPTKKGMGIYLMKSFDCIVSGNKVINTLINSDQSETLPSGAIALNEAINCTVDSNYISNSAMYGFVNAYGFNSTFTRNNISNIKKSAIYLITTSNNKIENNNVSEIGDVIIKGFFTNTSNKSFDIKLPTPFKNIQSGEYITIRNNEFNCNDKKLISFKGDALYSTKKPESLKNSIISNKIYGNQSNKNSSLFDMWGKNIDVKQLNTNTFLRK